ncbi:nucleobase:cation symporter-2 family protein [Aeromonas veronii]|uniref:nucleobase:cation symporter-2 family protein n=1 Tax=Aeromonas veronii TaxID=654 RepID=UPI0011160DF2|nr:nucleobase:cation symporter-2 family protein [Aeromonas veronii]TNI54689.1 purine permease [Aeromonas veronii]
MNETNPQSPRPGARKRPVDEVERMLPMGQLFTLGLQHVLVMYAGAVAVPLVIGGSLGLPKDQISYLISSDLFCCGIVTLLQCVGIGRFAGIRLPVIMSVTFAAGIISTLLVPLIGRLMPLFPTVVTGVVITSIGISIMQVGIDWMAGGKGNPEYGSLRYIGTSFLVLVFILLVTRFTKGFFSNISVLLGIIFGFVVAIAMGEVSLDGLGEAAWFVPIVPFAFGWPTFDPISIATLTVIMLITFIESMGMFLALGDIVGHPARRGDIVRGLRVDGIGTIIGGIFNSFPHTSFSQNIGLVSVTGVSSRWVCVMSGGILLAFGLIPKMSVLVASIPPFVLGGAGIVMFGMVLATGIRILARTDYNSNRHNLYIVAISLGIGMIPTVSGNFFQQLPAQLQPLFHSGILLATISSVLLNLFFNGYQPDLTHQTRPLFVGPIKPQQKQA